MRSTRCLPGRSYGGARFECRAGGSPVAISLSLVVIAMTTPVRRLIVGVSDNLSFWLRPP